jgi:hypothetical protein
MVQTQGGEVNLLSNKLQEMDKVDPGWKRAFWHNEKNYMSRFFWMSPYQVDLARTYGEALIFDVSVNRNIYKMYLTTFIVVDGENVSRNVAYCLSERQDTDTFTWMLEQYKAAINSKPCFAVFSSIWTDRDPAMAGAIESVYPDIFHGTCTWHLQENLDKNVKPRCQRVYHHFLNQFWECYRRGSPEAFEASWERLIDAWPSLMEYLQLHIYPDRHKWAWAWVGSRFAVGLRTTGRVENEHKNNRLLGLGGHSTLNEVFDKLCDRSERQRDDAFAKKIEVCVHVIFTNLGQSNPISFFISQQILRSYLGRVS